MVFPVGMYGCESWTIKKAEHWRTDAFGLWCWRRLENPLDCEEINQSIHRRSVLSVHWKDWCWSWNSNTLATWWEELTHLKRLWCWDRLRAGGEGDDRGWDDWMASLTQWTWVWCSTLGVGMDRKAWHAVAMGSQRVGQDQVTELNWTELSQRYHIKAPIESELILGDS